MQRVGIKLLNSDFHHYDVVYKESLNVDPVAWNPRGSCEPGGLYFTLPCHALDWFTEKTRYVADVVVPDDQPVWADDHQPTTKWKAPQLVLSNIRPLHEFLMTFTDLQLGVVIRHGIVSLDVYFESKALYRRCLALQFQSVSQWKDIDIDDWLYIARVEPCLLAGYTFPETVLLLLVQANPACLGWLRSPHPTVENLRGR
jgi:hypothetical protein